MRKKTIIKLISTFLIFFLILPLAESRSLQEIQDSGFIKVGAIASKSKRPVSFMKGGKKVGIDIDIIDLVANSLGVSVKRIEHSNLGERITVLEKGSVDIVVSSFSITIERKEKIDFSHQYLTTGIGVIMQKKFLNEVITFDDLSGKNIGVKKDSTAQTKFETKYPDINIIPLLKNEIEKKLISGELDGYANDALFLSVLEKKYPNKYYILKRTLSADSYGIGVEQNNKELLDAINKIIINKNKEIRKIEKKYGEALPIPATPTPTPTPNTSKITNCTEEYTVKTGDTLAQIAVDKLGDYSRWAEIYTRNTNVIADANFIRKNQKLIIILDSMCNLTDSKKNGDINLPQKEKLIKIKKLATEITHLIESMEK